MLERRGVISGYEGSKPRQVLVSQSELPRILERGGATAGGPADPSSPADGELPTNRARVGLVVRDADGSDRVPPRQPTQGESLMRTGSTRRPSPALIVAMIALVAALAGSAAALPGKNSVDKNDIKKNAIKSKQIKNGKVTSADLADGGVAAVDLAADEPFHKVGAAGEPALGNGAEGDCIWSAPPVGVPYPDLNPVGFYKDSHGTIHFSGVAGAADGPGGDANCGGPGSEEIEDATVFTLPAGYRPANVELIFGGGGLVLIAPDEGFVVGPDSVPPGAVLAASGSSAVLLDGAEFRAAGAGTAPIESPRVNPQKFKSMAQLRKLAG